MPVDLAALKSISLHNMRLETSSYTTPHGSKLHSHSIYKKDRVV